MAIEIVDFPIEHGDFPWQNVSSPEGNHVSAVWQSSPPKQNIAMLIDVWSPCEAKNRYLSGWQSLPFCFFAASFVNL